jgi:uncharacterized membrane protein YdjX (TVP38/TMEM64 family)
MFILDFILYSLNERIIFMLVDWFPSNAFWGVIISVVLNILVAITGILPSTFITIATVGFFQFEYALIILIIGEALGAIVSFILYRKGVKKILSYPKMSTMNKNKYLQKLRNADGWSAIILVLLLRVLPFVPSGAVTLTAALSSIHVIPFSLASTIGKIPALVIEAYSVAHILTLQKELQIAIIFVVIVVFLVFVGFKKRGKKK